MHAPADPLLGRTLSRYRLVERIGAGAMGVVYRARDDRLDRDVAIKILPERALPDEPSRRRFRLEAVALSRLNHADIETALYFGSAGGTGFLGTEVVPGHTLLHPRQLSPLRERDAIAIRVPFAYAL